MKDNKTIYEKLQTSRVELQDLNLKKTGENKYSGFKYYELKDFLSYANEILLKNRLSSAFSMGGDEAVLTIYDFDSDNTMEFKTPVASATTYKKNGDPVNLAIQDLGSQHTYLKRYTYFNALEIIEDDNIDKNIGRKDQYNNKPNKNEEALSYINNTMEDLVKNENVGNGSRDVAIAWFELEEEEFLKLYRHNPIELAELIKNRLEEEKEN